jgi:hypothetical protein
MPNYIISTRQLLIEAFGIVGFRRYNTQSPRQPARDINYGDVPTINLTKQNASSVFGTPVLDTIKVEAGTIPGTGESYDEYVFPVDPVVDINRAKHVVRTQVAGKNGTVKELISLDDYDINIRGVLVNMDGDDLPHDAIADMKRMFELPVSLSVHSDLFQLLGIYNIVITDIKWPALEGYSNVQPYVITAYSDEPRELKQRDGI